MAVTFRFKEYLSDLFGKIRRPIAIVHFQRLKSKSWVPINMLIDTGADYTLLPRYIALELEVSTSRDCKLVQSRGIGGNSDIYLLKNKMKVKIGNYKRMIPVGFSSSYNIPPLLGRQEFFEKFKVTFDKFQVKFE